MQAKAQSTPLWRFIHKKLAKMKEIFYSMDIFHLGTERSNQHDRRDRQRSQCNQRGAVQAVRRAPHSHAGRHLFHGQARPGAVSPVRRVHPGRQGEADESGRDLVLRRADGLHGLPRRHRQHHGRVHGPVPRRPRRDLLDVDHRHPRRRLRVRGVHARPDLQKAQCRRQQLRRPLLLHAGRSRPALARRRLRRRADPHLCGRLQHARGLQHPEHLRGLRLLQQHHPRDHRRGAGGPLRGLRARRRQAADQGHRGPGPRDGRAVCAGFPVCGHQSSA